MPEALVAATNQPEAAVNPTEEEESAPAALVVDAPAGPSSEEEAAFLAQDRSAEQADSLQPTIDSAEPGKGETTLPPLEDLVNRIPAPARELMEELFRARFVTVKRLPKSALKS